MIFMYLNDVQDLAASRRILIHITITGFLNFSKENSVRGQGPFWLISARGFVQTSIALP